MAWRVLHVGFENDGLAVDGVEVWKNKWCATGEPPLWLPHPQYPNQTHRYDIYEVATAGDAVRFAAGELSYGIWGFYIPDEC